MSDMRRLIEQVDRLAEDRIARNAEIARLTDQLQGAVGALQAIATYVDNERASAKWTVVKGMAQEGLR
jgi:hypothetical protein